MTTHTSPDLRREVLQFVLRDFTPRFGQLEEKFPSNASWLSLRKLGTHLWLDTGSLEESGQLWCREFGALTTNNTLLNKEVQRGTYDALIPKAADLLRRHGLSGDDLLLEIAFILNARHGLTLVQRYDAYVSVEEHTDLAHDLEGAVETARRYHEICPERFIVKLPMTPEGILATRRLAMEDINVNHTLGFSARQNYVITRIAAPAYVNVFLGRLNSFVADNGLGSGESIGEKATLASQRAVRTLREQRHLPTLQIGASYRKGEQVRDLAGIDVMTMPPKVARQFLEIDEPVINDRTGDDPQPPLNDGVDARKAGLHTLWEIDDAIVEACDALDHENLDAFSGDDLAAFFRGRGVEGLFVDWSDEQIRRSREEGKIPKLENWRDELASGRVGLDALMNLAGLNSFREDQQAMDDRVAETLRAKGQFESGD